MSHVEAIAFNGPLGTLRGMLHRPDGESSAPVIVLLHGFTGQHIEDHRLYVQMGRHLADAGFAALRFDFYGSGDSDGDFEDFTVQTEVNDAAAALDWIGQQPGLDAARIGVVGLSMGGAVTALLAGRDPRVKAAVFWNSLALPDRHFHEVEQTGRNAGVVGGMRVGRKFMRTFPKIDPVEALRKYAGPGLVIQGTGDDLVSVEEARALKAALRGRGTLRLVDGANHTFQHPAWRRKVFGITTRWLAKHLQ
ncbi:MAG: alpha/beta fold hydrolase [Anaerolineae bacterium]|nr:alpha/beta fold hydrolase [Anaerolineae bacterium]